MEIEEINQRARRSDFYIVDPSIVSYLPSSLSEAREEGFRVYYTDRYCVRGHKCPRYSVDGACIECRHEINAKVWKKGLKDDDKLIPLEGEEFKEHPFYKGLLVSNKGRFYREKFTYESKGNEYKKPATYNIRGQYIKLSTNKKGYLSFSITLPETGQKKHMQAHRIVAETFIGLAPSEDHQIDHLNGIVDDNRPENLEWVLVGENLRRMWANPERALCSPKREDHGMAKLTEEQIREIRETYIPRHPELSQTALAKKYNISQSQMSSIINKKTWKDS